MTYEALPLPDIAERLGVKYTRVRQLVADHKLLAYRNDDGILVVPEVCLVEEDGRTIPLPDLRGTLLTLLDGGFTTEEAGRWLLTPHPVLGREPIELLREGAHKRVNRQARAEAF
ncbi:MAG: Rv2175c family DNA-binding protein [Actinomycetaceae bacterium]|nr:Rv2175c family DNA-binding protein [Actinomycetaceae bacterium]MDU0969395.1 Rv2175c family DNA-binding protein [Actinomycetaceae bacterium]